MEAAHTPGVAVQPWVEAALRVFDDPAWYISVAGYQPELEHDIEIPSGARQRSARCTRLIRGANTGLAPAHLCRRAVRHAAGNTPHSALVPGPD